MRGCTIVFAGASFFIAGAGLVGTVALGIELAFCYVPTVTPLNDVPLCGPDIWGQSWVPFALFGISVALIVAWLVGGLGTWALQVWRAHRYRRLLLTVAIDHPAAAVRQKGRPEVVVAGVPQPLALTVGIVRPRVIISIGAVDALADDQLQAVLEHEAHHARRHDPATYAVVRAADRALPFLPVVRGLSRRTILDAEIEADAAAISRVGRRPLLQALELLDAADARVPAAAVGSIDGMVGDRIRVLAGRGLAPPVTRWDIVRSVLGAGVVAVPTLGILIAIARTQ